MGVSLSTVTAPVTRSTPTCLTPAIWPISSLTELTPCSSYTPKPYLILLTLVRGEGKNVAVVFARLEAFGERFRLERGLAPEHDWIACDRLLDPHSDELTRVLDAERQASGQVSDHATALTVMAVYAGTVTAAALLAWAIEDVVVDMRPGNVAIRLSPHHGFEAVGLREPYNEKARWTGSSHGCWTSTCCPWPRPCGCGRGLDCRQLHGGVAHGCAAAFCIASRRGGDIDLLEQACQRFLNASTGGL